MLLQKIIEISKLSGRLVVLVVHYSKINWKNKHVASDVFAKKNCSLNMENMETEIRMSVSGGE